MTLKKYGDSEQGRVLPDENEEQRKTAKANWTEEDQEELIAEIKHIEPDPD